jgi:4'-phosphopantetheinyl transferase EntD
VIEEILPSQVAAVDIFGDPPGAMLFPEEEAVIRKAVEKRRLEFTAARHCARAAMARLGQRPVPILPGARGAPQWPPGLVGSMTHCAAYRAGAVAHASDMITLGIDAEEHEVLPPGIHDLVTIPEERRELDSLCAIAPGVCWDRVLFSAKESVYKAWYPLMNCWLGFEEAHVTIDPARGVFTAQLLVSGPAIKGKRLSEFGGRWLVQDGLIITAIAVSSPAGT